MSYLKLPKGVPNFSKAVFSLWFRVPIKSAIAASSSKLATGAEGFEMMQSILPLVTFGQPQVNRNYQPRQHDVANWITPVPNPSPWFEVYYIEGSSYDVDPSCIGLLCSDDGWFTMTFNVQTEDYMSLGSAGWITTQMNLWAGDDPAAPNGMPNIPGSGYVQHGFNVGQAIIQEASYIDNAQPEFFNVQTDKLLAPDTWHHLLLSFDIGDSVSIGHPWYTSDCRLWYAIDDVDYRGAAQLGPFRDSADNLDDNAIVTRNVWRLSGIDPANPKSYLYQNHPIPLPSGTYDSGSIPSSNADMGLPASTKYVDSIFRVEMAELQIFTGVVLDTGKRSNRRAFVDADGKPVNPTGTTDKPAPAETLLGKKPDVLLHGSNNWQTGLNTGTLGIDLNTDGNATNVPDGQFIPVAGIEKFKPEPELTETPTA